MEPNKTTIKTSEKGVARISADTLKRISPYITTQRANKYGDLLNSCMRQFGLMDNPQRAAMFLAQVMHESGHFRYTEEIASGKAYEWRADLGNTQAGDGVKYKGRGLLQITGRANYTRMAKLMGLDLVNRPEILATEANAVLSACYWWQDRAEKLNRAADVGDVDRVTRIINGGLNGYAERKQLYDKAIKVLCE